MNKIIIAISLSIIIIITSFLIMESIIDSDETTAGTSSVSVEEFKTNIQSYDQGNNIVVWGEITFVYKSSIGDVIRIVSEGSSESIDVSLETGTGLMVGDKVSIEFKIIPSTINSDFNSFEVVEWFIID